MRISDWSSDVCSSDLARIEAESPAPAALGGIEGEVGVADKVVVRQAVERRDRDPDRGADDAAAALDRIGLRQVGDDLARPVAQLATILLVGKNDLALVAAAAADHPLVAAAHAQPFR